eukprot:scaffold26539_cov33-Tisochrysis_lutea.AAC.5
MYEDVDLRYTLREAIAHLPRAPAATIETCFILGMKPHPNPSNPFNVRAWLFYEAGRRNDVDLSPLEDHNGMWPLRGHSSWQWWKRATAHAAGSRPARYYGLALLEPLLALPRVEMLSLLKPVLMGEAPEYLLAKPTNKTRGIVLYSADVMQSTLDRANLSRQQLPRPKLTRWLFG